MNPIALAHNFFHSFLVCPTWNDRINRLLWLYSNKSFLKKLSQEQRYISFAYPPPIGNIQVIVRDNQGSDNFIFSEVFDHKYYDLPLPFSPNTILDLGANIGLTSIYFGRKYPRAQIAAIEPIPKNVDLLQKNIKINRIKATIFPAAVAVEDGCISMEIAPLDYGHKIANIDYGKAFAGETIQVEAISILSLMKKLSWERINLLKVDIEGYEGILLKERCEWLSLVDAMCIECHEGFGESELQEIASKWGFNPPELLPGTWLLIRK